jgi:riboflavin synthase
MFTGIIQSLGRVAALQDRGGDLRLTIDASELAARIGTQRLAVGESVAVNGVCLTVIDPEAGCFSADVSRETLSLTTLAELAVDAPVNLEAALRAGDPLGGHLMSGHVDGVGTVLSVSSDARSWRVQVQVPEPLARFLAPKGSIGLDGVSLTVNAVDGASFGVNLIPHTVSVTTFGHLQAGSRLNIEVDQLARYLERLLALRC